VTQVRLDTERLEDLLRSLAEDGREIIGPTVSDGAVVYAPIAGVGDLPKGIVERQGPGRYRLIDTGTDAYFDHVVGPLAWKRFLYPPEQKLCTINGSDGGFAVSPEVPDAPARAFFGVRACDLAAVRILDRVFDNGDFADSGYGMRRGATLIVAVNCGRAGETCFCASMNTGPKADAGYDIALTEVPDAGYFVAEAASPPGRDILDRLDLPAATADEVAAAEARIAEAAQSMGRHMPSDAAEVLRRNLDSPHWDAVAERCLNCANCTMACPTCFCTTVEDVTDLSGDHAERWRKWDSCFTMDFSYMHGGSLRRSGRARYRQWMTHKLAHWHDQFDSSGCVGCGRCIAWCPVGIDITAEAQAIKETERGA
jgi:sulfhydrogenase subunit beta (sulfur reductase)